MKCCYNTCLTNLKNIRIMKNAINTLYMMDKVCVGHTTLDFTYKSYQKGMKSL